LKDKKFLFEIVEYSAGRIISCTTKAAGCIYLRILAMKDDFQYGLYKSDVLAPDGNTSCEPALVVCPFTHICVNLF
jgi:hypothetical protein